MITDSEVFCMNFDTDIFFGYDLDCGEIWFEHRETKDRATFSTTGSDELLNLIEIIGRKCPQQNFHQKFSFGQEMGKSKNSKVYLAERKRDGAIFAVKVQKDVTQYLILSLPRWSKRSQSSNSYSTLTWSIYANTSLSLRGTST